MSELGGSSPAFVVSWNGRVRQQLKNLLIHSREIGQFEQVKSAIETIQHRLATDPWGFGEAKYPRRSMKLIEHLVIVRPLALHYGIHIEQPVVFPTDIKGLPGSGLRN